MYSNNLSDEEYQILVGTVYRNSLMDNLHKKGMWIDKNNEFYTINTSPCDWIFYSKNIYEIRGFLIGFLGRE
ncbi:hypothetical protein D3Z60_23060 [Lachnospiraceae bacterium]|jgi:hypothetical protein|nr:hypothetical protein [Lachnospiraceae bacterium]